MTLINGRGLALANAMTIIALFVVGLLAAPLNAAPLPGQIVVDPNNPAWLIYHGGGSFFMAGPGDPEDFLYRGSQNPNGTRSGDQITLINKLIGTDANSIYLMGIRSHGGDGDSSHNPFVNNDPNQGMNSAVLNQWETWFDLMDANGITIFFFFYDDSIRVSNSLGWPLDGSNNLHPQERLYIDTIVNRLEKYKHLIWVVMEEVQEMGSDYVAHAKAIAKRIKQVDDHDHVVAVHKLSGLSFTGFADDPNIDQFAIQYNKDSAEQLHDGMVTAWNNAAGKYNLNLAEAANFGSGEELRKKAWAIAMGGAYVMVLRMTIDTTPLSDLRALGRVVTFFEDTNINEMSPHDELSFAGTEYVLAKPGNSYIAYASNLSGNMGIKNLTAGQYDFNWFDPVDGSTVNQKNVTVGGGSRSWSKPGSIGNEVALYLQRTSDPPLPSPGDGSILPPIYLLLDDEE